MNKSQIFRQSNGFLTLTLLTATLVFSTNARSETESRPILSELVGTKSVKIKGPDGKVATAKEGQFVALGTTLAVEPKTSIVLTYENGFKAAIRGKSVFKVVKTEKSDSTTLDMAYGKLRAFTGKNVEESKKKQFYIKTPTSVVGVRGTDFVVNQEPGAKSSEVRTLDGEVSVGKDLSSLLSGKGMAVSKGQLANITSGPLPKIESFDTGKYLTDLKTNDPTLAEASALTLDPKRQEEMRGKFDSERKKREEELKKKEEALKNEASSKSQEANAKAQEAQNKAKELEAKNKELEKQNEAAKRAEEEKKKLEDAKKAIGL